MFEDRSLHNVKDGSALAKTFFSFGRVSGMRSETGDRWVANFKGLDLEVSSGVRAYLSQLRLFDDFLDQGRESDCRLLLKKLEKDLNNLIPECSEEVARPLSGLYNLRAGDLAMLKSDHELAEIAYDLASEELGNLKQPAPLLQGRIALHRAEMKLRMKEFSDAEALFERTVGEFNKVDPEHRLAGYALVRLADLQTMRGDHGTAAANRDRGEGILESKEISFEEVTARERGIDLKAASNYDFSEVPELARLLANKPNGRKDSPEAVIEWMYKVFGASEELFYAQETDAVEAALGIALTVARDYGRAHYGEEDCFQVAQILGRLGWNAQNAGDFSKAARFYDEALSIFGDYHPEDVNEQQIVVLEKAQVLMGCAALSERAGTHDKALQNYKLVVEALSDYNILDPLLVTALEKAGQLSQRSGDETSAVSFLKRARAIRAELKLDNNGDQFF